MKKLISLCLAVLCAFSFVACKPDSGTTSSSSDSSSSSSSGETIEEVLVQNGTIIQNKQTDYAILLAGNASESNQFAALELQNFVEEATDVTLPIVYDNAMKPLGTKYISLGRTTLREQAGFVVDYSSLNHDGFVIKSDDDKNLFIDAATNSGVLNGTYDFLETFVGVRFLTETYNYVPELEEVPFYDIDRTSIPAFAVRDYYAKSTMQNKLYTARMRLNSKFGNTPTEYGENGGNIYYCGDGHTLISELDALVPYEKYGIQYPHWYCHDGQELCYTNGLTEEDEFDKTNKTSLIYNLIEIIKARILAKPDAKYFMLGQADNTLWCDCEASIASGIRNGGKSGTLMVFVNTIAEQIEKWLEEENIDREVTFVTFAYWKTINAPVKLENEQYVPYNDKVKARDNVAVKIAHMTCSYHSLEDGNICGENATANAKFETWSAITDKILVWDYVTNYSTHFFWFPNYNSIAKNLKYYRDKGAIEVMSQGAPHVSEYYQFYQHAYIYSKLMWNPDLDVNELIHEFNYYYFGEESCKVVDEFCDLMTYHYTSLGGSDSSYHSDLYQTKDFQSFSWYPIGFLERAEALIEDEIARVSTREGLSSLEKDTLILKLKRVLVHPKFMILWNYDAYYDSDGKKAYASDFFSLCLELGIEYYGEGFSINELKGQFGVT